MGVSRKIHGKCHILHKHFSSQGCYVDMKLKERKCCTSPKNDIEILFMLGFFLLDVENDQADTSIVLSRIEL